MYRRHPSNATASGYLNVDYVTRADHFKKLQLRSHLIGETPTLLEAELALDEWLSRVGETLVQRGYVSSGCLIELKRSKRVCAQNISERKKIHTLPRLRRILPVVRMYLNGGYRQFRGFKSAAKDILLV
jgi:hypothetical protein